MPFIVWMFTALVVLSCQKSHDFDQAVLNLPVNQKINGLDPIYANDRYSGNEVARLYEGLLEYHYLKRPYELVPNLAKQMPEVSENGLVYTFSIRDDVLFHDCPCFAEGKGRKLKAEDFVYSIKRVADPKLQSTGWWLFDGKIKGLNEWRKKYAQKSKVDYDEEVEGLKVVGENKIRFTLAKPFPQFLYALAMPFSFVVPREAVEHYGSEFLNHPVGTGPFVIRDGVYRRGSNIVYFRNPNFRDKLYPSEGEPEDKKAGLLNDAGRKLPLVDKLVVHLLEEPQPLWLNFLRGRLDFMSIPKDNFDQVVTPDRDGLTEEFRDKGIILSISPSLDITYIAFNHKDELFKNNIKLRQAMSLAYNVERSNELFFNNTAMIAQSVIPPGIAGYDADFKNPFQDYDLKRAKKLLAQAGYPGGKGLPTLVYETVAQTVSRQMAEFFAKSMAKIGVKVTVSGNTWPQLVKKVNTGQAQLFGMAWGADYPDAENFLQLLYGPNSAPGANGSNFNDPEFNRLFEKAAFMQHSPERTQLYERLNHMAALKVPWIYGLHRNVYQMRQGWVRNYKYTEFELGRAQYLGVDNEKKKQLVQKL